MRYFKQILFLLSMALLPHFAMAQPTCTPACNLTGVVNDYWIGTGNPAANTTSLALGARRAGGAGNTIAVGDLLMVMQMQDATVNTANTAAYGSSGVSGTGTGYVSARNTGRYEYVYASNAVTSAGGALNITTGLINAYNTTVATGSQTAPTFQVIRVPNCDTATLTGVVTAPAWSTSTGGVVAIRAVNLNMNGQTINANNLGFRGGATDPHNNNTDTNNFASNNNQDQFKGEGFAGTPRYLFSVAANAEVDTGIEFPAGNRARGAPANAGGGGEGDSAGGGGANGGGGGVGGVWANGPPVGGDVVGADGGGRGGSVFAERAFNRVVLGGGGGGGSAGANQQAQNPNTLPRVAADFSRGGAGGGIVVLQALNRTGTLTINANGQNAPFSTFVPQAATPPPYSTGIQVGGGGGAGGSVVLYGNGGTVIVNSVGGNGATAQRTDTQPHIAHGGGGGGGVIFSSSAAGMTANTTGGQAGCQLSTLSDNGTGGLATGICNVATNAFNSTQGANGPALQTFTASPPGNPLCPANLSITKNNLVGTLTAGQTTSYTVTVANLGPNSATNSILRDPPATGLNCTAVTCTSSTPGGLCPGGVTISNLQNAGITLTSLPANSTLNFSVTCGVTATGQ